MQGALALGGLIWGGLDWCARVLPRSEDGGDGGIDDEGDVDDDDDDDDDDRGETGDGGGGGVLLENTARLCLRLFAGRPTAGRLLSCSVAVCTMPSQKTRT